MTAGWVASTIRGRALLHSTVGTATARTIATAPTWDEARRELERTINGRTLPADADRTAARAAASTSTVWQLRVLAGWAPPTETALVRVAAGPIEIGNIEQHLARLDGATGLDEPVALGSLAVAWPRVASVRSAEAVRSVLRRSVWGDPGGDDPTAISLGLRVAWLRRVLRADPATHRWVSGALAVVVARERFTFGREISTITTRDIERMLPRRMSTAGSLPVFVDLLPPRAVWPFERRDGRIDDPAELWRAEAAVLRRVDDDARRQVAAGRATRAGLTAILALLLIDLWRVGAAIELAGHGAAGEEVFDALAA